MIDKNIEKIKDAFTKHTIKKVLIMDDAFDPPVHEETMNGQLTNF